ncbi:hypothetical protein ILUMI_05391 [Ignelater luminosus]|uniref:Cyclin B n=1 Tax=Ignelater luminosus TaxID=2038154 RepID=A0A8K0DB49_IGNLU|nr:hypothetical protein ILUMI_05391 [Ignelater luminosus]
MDKKTTIPIKVTYDQLNFEKANKDIASIVKKENITKVSKVSTTASSSQQNNIQLPKLKSRILSDTAVLIPQKKLKTGINHRSTRAPLIDLDRNVNTSKVKEDRTKITVRKSLTPYPTAVINDVESDTDEVFVDGAQHYLAYKSESSKQNDRTQVFLTSLNGNKHFSPIRSNIYAAKSTIISQGIPEKTERHGKKKTLSYGRQSIVNRQSTPQLKYLDDYYNTEYLQDILLYQLKNDWKYTVAQNFLKFHNSHNNESRTAVINWIIRAQDYFNSSVSVLFTTIRLFDKLLENIFIPCNMCQLIGLVITWIIYKYEDDKNLLTVTKMLALCNGTYTAEQFLKMEKKILTFFNFDISVPDVTIYVESHIIELKIENELLTQCVYYILECYALTTRFSTDIPSVQAAAAICLALNILYPSLKLWNRLEKVIGYYAEKEIANTMDGMLHQVHKIQDPEYKYRQPYYKYSTKDREQASLVLLHRLVAS